MKFTCAVLDPIPSKVSYNTVTAIRYGERAAELIGELIHAFSQTNKEKA